MTINQKIVELMDYFSRKRVKFDAYDLLEMFIMDLLLTPTKQELEHRVIKTHEQFKIYF